MFEYNGIEFFSQSDRDMAEIAALQAKVVELEHQLVKAEQARDFHKELHFKFAGIIDQARESIEEVLAGDVNAKQTVEDFEHAFALLGVTLDREVEIEVSMTWRGSIRLPFGVDVEDLDIDDFASCDPDHSEYDSSFYGGLHDYSIEER